MGSWLLLNPAVCCPQTNPFAWVFPEFRFFLLIVWSDKIPIPVTKTYVEIEPSISGFPRPQPCSATTQLSVTVEHRARLVRTIKLIELEGPGRLNLGNSRLFCMWRTCGHTVLWCFVYTQREQSAVHYPPLSPTARGIFLYHHSGGNYTHRCDSSLKTHASFSETILMWFFIVTNKCPKI